MFRGLTRREHAIGVGLLLLLAGGVGVRQWLDQPGYETAITGHALDHPPGQLRLETGSGAPLSASVVNGRIDINTASAALLEELPGIGPVRAASIVAWREEHGPFARVEDLDHVPGIGEKTVERLQRSVIAGSPQTPAPGNEFAAPDSLAGTPWGIVQRVGAIPATSAGTLSPQPVAPAPADRPVRINVATETELQLLNGIGPALARRIVEDRARRGPFRSADDLQRVSGIGPVTVDKNRHRIVVN